MAFWNRRKKRREEEEQIRLAEEAFRVQRALEERRGRKGGQQTPEGQRGTKGVQQTPEEQHGRKDGQIQTETQSRNGQEQTNAGIEGKFPEMEQEELQLLSERDKKRYIKECHEAIREIDQQIAEAKKEYEKVTSRLTDIQRIDRIAGEERTELEEVCKRILRLIEERNQYKNRSLTITDAQIRRFDLYDENGLSDEIKKMYDLEVFQKAVESDLEHLDGEKHNLHQEQREIVEKQNALKGMARVLIALILSLFVLFAVIYYALQVDMTFPYLGTVLLAAISSTVIFVESNRNRAAIVVVGRKIDKAISLTNRIKIKYVNNRNVLDYNREKYQVKDAADFEKLWIEYRRAKEYERKFQENTEQLNRYHEILLEQLRVRKVAEPDIWLSQTLAMIDQREMVEIRHALNVQRGKLRDRIQYNETAKRKLLTRIHQILHGEAKD